MLTLVAVLAAVQVASVAGGLFLWSRHRLEWIALRSAMVQLLEEHHSPAGVQLDNAQRLVAARQRVEQALHGRGKKASARALAHIEKVLK